MALRPLKAIIRTSWCFWLAGWLWRKRAFTQPSLAKRTHVWFPALLLPLPIPASFPSAMTLFKAVRIPTDEVGLSISLTKGYKIIKKYIEDFIYLGVCTEVTVQSLYQLTLSSLEYIFSNIALKALLNCSRILVNSVIGWFGVYWLLWVHNFNRSTVCKNKLPIE